MNKLLKRLLPWDINPTNGGAFVILLALVQEIVVGYWMIAQPTHPVWVAWLSGLPAVLIVLVMIAIVYYHSPHVWSHFVGTDVKCRDQAHLDAMSDWAWANHRLWSEFTERVDIKDMEYSMRFRDRNKAMLAKLSVP